MARAILLVLAFATAGPAAALAEAPAAAAPAPAVTNAAAEVAQAGPAGPPERAVAVRHDGRRTMGRLPANLGWGFVGVFHKDNLVPFLVGGAAAGGAALVDDDVRSSVANPDSGFGKALETAGGWPTSVLVVGLFTAGRFADGSRFRAMSYDLLDATVVNFGYTELLKVTVGRERPDGSDNKSFPSGHASNAFTLATVAERHYGWKVGVPAYAVAAAISYSRIVRDKHYLSDVVAGATLGYIVGRTVVRVNNRGTDGATHAGATLSVAPIVARHVRGLQMTATF
jgi:membrane-associated phospholipid phosphatase